MSGEQILVVEDNKTTASLMQLKLENLGYKVPSLARNADEAIQQAGKYHPALVLMDINLGKGADGIEAADIIKKKFKIPIIFVTRYSDDTTLARAKNIHPLGYINKPLRDKDIRSTIEIAMERIRSSANKTVPLEGEESDPEIRVEIFCNADGSIRDFNQTIMDRVLGSLGIETPEELLPINHFQINSYCLRLDNSHLIAGRLLDYIFTWEYLPDSQSRTVRIICENITSKNRLADSHANEDAFKQALNYLSVGVMMINQKMHPTFINDAAKNLIGESTQLEIKSNQLWIRDSYLANEFRQLVERPANGKITVTDTRLDQTIDILISPLLSGLTERSEEAPAVIAFFFAGRKDREHLEEVLERLYKLTKAEARLAAALVQDPRLEEAASSIGITVNTAR
ncbi:MAG: response regulator, partial [Gammaproteobacteria bacterium]|nr:response regulator [Gammaproteobacteria bacterium]